MPHINITTSSTGSNADSCGQLVEYLEKENNLKAEHKAELGFNQGLHQRGELKSGPQMHVQIIVSPKDIANQRLWSPLTNHRGQGKSAKHGHKFGQFKQSCERAFDAQLDYRRDLEESFRYQNTMSNGTTQEKAAMTLELREVQQERQQQLAANLRRAKELRIQIEQAKKIELSQQRELTLQQEQKQSRGLGM